MKQYLTLCVLLTLPIYGCPKEPRWFLAKFVASMGQSEVAQELAYACRMSPQTLERTNNACIDMVDEALDDIQEKITSTLKLIPFYSRLRKSAVATELIKNTPLLRSCAGTAPKPKDIQ